MADEVTRQLNGADRDERGVPVGLLPLVAGGAVFWAPASPDAAYDQHDVCDEDGHAHDAPIIEGICGWCGEEVGEWREVGFYDPDRPTRREFVLDASAETIADNLSYVALRHSGAGQRAESWRAVASASMTSLLPDDLEIAAIGAGILLPRHRSQAGLTAADIERHKMLPLPVVSTTSEKDDVRIKANRSDYRRVAGKGRRR